MLFFWILACGTGQDSPEVTPTTEPPVVGQNKEVLKGPPNSPNVQGRNGNGPRQQGPMNDPKGPPNGGNPPMGVGNGPTPEPFHATVTFDWVEPSNLSKEPKSIIWISLDTVHAKRMSVYGGPAQVPNLEKFAQHAVVFEQAISHFPETALSHWTMFSSVLPEVHGNVPANGGSLYTGPTLADIAKHHQYTTGGFIGGVTMTDQASGFGRGFDVYDDQFTFSFEDMSRDGVEVTQNTLRWIEEQSGPFVAFAHYFDAHFPYTPKKNLYDPDYKGQIDGTDAVLRPYRDGQKTPSTRDVQHVLALYDAEITELDEKIAPLLALANDNTLVVVTADHGESFSHDYYFNHRAGLWDEVTHVPLLIGGGTQGAKRVSQQVGLIDILPTVLDMSGLPSDRRFMGTSRVGWFDNTTPSTEMVYSITDPWMPEPQFAVRTETSKWIDGLKQTLVYDLRSDPLEGKSSTMIPTSLQSAKEQYQEIIDSYQQWLAESPRKRQISDEECKRLMALGYTTCMPQ